MTSNVTSEAIVNEWKSQGKQIDQLQQEIEQFKQKQDYLNQQNHNLIEGELRQLVKLFVAFAVKDYTSGKKYEYPWQLLDDLSDKPPYSFERYWLAYWKLFQRYARIRGMKCEYFGALDLDSLDLWRVLQGVDAELKKGGQYRKLKHDGYKINFENYQQSLKALELC